MARRTNERTNERTGVPSQRRPSNVARGIHAIDLPRPHLSGVQGVHVWEKRPHMMGQRGVHSVAPAARFALKSPYPYFGGKRRVAPLVWSRLGNVRNYVEPFFGGGSVLLGRADPPNIETINDLDCDIANVWRAIKARPDLVAKHADWPVNEADLHAMHRWLVETKLKRALRIRRDPEYFDAKAAGRWLYGICLWIGGDWCRDLSAKRPILSGNSPGIGVHRKTVYLGGGAGGGSGVHAPTLHQKKPRLRQGGNARSASTGGAIVLTQQLPSLTGDAGATGRGIHASGRYGALYGWMDALCERMRRVRVCAGDWSRVLTPSVTTYLGLTGVFLDPPYQHDLRQRCYAEDHDISADVRNWALEHGDDPLFRIALCGYEAEHGIYMPSSWECIPWKAHGGYSRSKRGKANRDQERIWFSPHCLPRAELPLFAEATV